MRSHPTSFPHCRYIEIFRAQQLTACIQRLLLQTAHLQLIHLRSSAARRASLRKDLKMNHRRFFNRKSTGVALLGMALCVPAAMLAQDTTPPPPDSQGMAGQQSNPGAKPMSTMGHRHQPPSPERQLKHLTKMLNLSSDQQQQMLPILQDQHKRMESIRSHSALNPDQRHQQMRGAMMDTHQKLEALMTDSQKRQFEQDMQQRHDRMGRGMMGHGIGGAGTPPPPPAEQNPPPPPPQ